MNKPIQNNNVIKQTHHQLEKRRVSEKHNTSRLFKEELALKRLNRQTWQSNDLSKCRVQRKSDVHNDQESAVSSEKDFSHNKNENVHEAKKHRDQSHRDDQSSKDDQGQKFSDVFREHLLPINPKIDPQSTSFLPRFSKEILSSLIESIHACLESDNNKSIIIVLNNGILSGTNVRVIKKGNAVQIFFKTNDLRSKESLIKAKGLLRDRLVQLQLPLSEITIH